MKKEIWKDIKGYEGLYQVSNYGRVKSLDRKSDIDGRLIKSKILKPGLNNPGYKFVILRKNGISENKMIHRLVAETFLNNPMDCVNHKDGNKLNNHMSNLEWCTYSENKKHAYETGLSPQRGKPKKVNVLTPNGEKLIFNTMNDVNKYFGFKKCWIHNRLRKHGNNFKYKNHLIEVID